MHPGWSDTPAVQTSMPSFREKMINKLRTPEQGADTLVWMCCCPNLEQSFENGAFFQGKTLKHAIVSLLIYFYFNIQDRQSVSKHLPLAQTRSTLGEETEFMKKMDELYEKFKA